MPKLRDTWDKARIYKILNENSDKDFVKRVLSPEDYGTIPLENGYGTHLMSYATDDEGAFAYPQIITDPATGELKRLSSREAMDYAYKNKQYIRFKDPEEADWFGKNYKRVWERP